MGEEEATMRERIVEAMARAISRASGWPQDMWDNPEEYSTSRVAKEAYVAFATIALDAALGMLETPSEEMVAAGAKEWCRWNRDDSPGTGEIPCIINAMLATLRSPKI